MKKNVQIVVVTYNPLVSYHNGIHIIDGIPVLFVSGIFNPKSKDRPNEKDPDFQNILQYQSTIRYAIVFLGKKESGSLKIVDIFYQHFRTKVRFQLCHHDHNEKVAYLGSKGIQCCQINSFIDHCVLHDRTMQCCEEPALLGAMHYLIWLMKK